MREFTPGGIRCPEAYAQGKMLDHSWWYGKLERGITPSDIDAFIEADGCFLWWEVSRVGKGMEHMSSGQRTAFMRLAERSGDAFAIVHHNLLSMSKPIDTANDVVSATVYFDSGTRTAVLDGGQWRAFCVAWTKSGLYAQRKYLEPNEQHAAAMCG